MMRRPVILGLSAVGLSLIFNRFYNSKIEQPQQFLLAKEESLASPPVTHISATSDTTIWSKLQQQKGCIIMMRHALAPGIGDPLEFRLNDCSTQRNLSDEGRKQAVRTGKAFKSKNIKVSRVLSSQWCRCLETAKLLNLGAVQPFAPLNSFFNNYSTASKQTAQVRQFILNNRNNPGVIVMVTHEVNITTLVGDIYPQSGASVVLRGNKENKIEIVGQIQAL